MQIIEKKIALLDLNMVVPSAEAAKEICKNWSKKSQDIYGIIMDFSMRAMFGQGWIRIM